MIELDKASIILKDDYKKICANYYTLIVSCLATIQKYYGRDFVDKWLQHSSLREAKGFSCDHQGLHDLAHSNYARRLHILVCIFNELPQSITIPANYL